MEGGARLGLDLGVLVLRGYIRGWGRGTVGVGKGHLKSPIKALDLEASRCSEHTSSSPSPPSPLCPLLFIVLPFLISALEKCLKHTKEKK